MANQDHRIGWDFVASGYRAADRLNHWIPIVLERSLDLDGDDQTLAGSGVVGKGCRSRGLNRFVALLDRLLDVLRVLVDPAHDDQIFDPACNIELSFAQESQVAGAQIRSVAILGRRMEYFLGDLWFSQ